MIEKGRRAYALRFIIFIIGENMEEPAKIRISVRNLVEFILRTGDIDNRREGFGEKEAMQEGSRIHRRIQGRMGSNYQAEVPLSMDVSWEDCTLTVEGRADGIFSEEPKRDHASIFIDEIKGMYRDVLSLEEPFMLHLAQAKCYAYIYASQNSLKRIGVQMTYCNLESMEIKRFRQDYALKELEEWFDDLVGRYRKWAKFQTEWKNVSRASIHSLEFPFAWRPGQKETASSVYRTILRRKTLFIQAPTGTGKTLSCVYPAVKAVGEGLADKIFYATAKTVTGTVAEECFDILRDSGLRMKTVTLTAKEKICFEGDCACNPDACPYAKGHYDRVNEAVFELISGEDKLDRSAIEAQARKCRVCPFELGLDAALWTDGVICDYNYIFDPRARLRRFFGEGAKGDYLFLIDEAHNLVDRGREMFSASLYKEDFLALKRDMQGRSKKITKALNRCNSWLLERKRECESVQVLEPGQIGTFPVYLMNLCGLIEEFLDSAGGAAADEELNQKVLDLYFQARRFLDTCDCLDDNYMIYTEYGADGRFLIRLFCVDVSENLQECLDRGRSTIYFSATMLPIQYYKSLLSTGEEDYAIYAHSSFDPARLQVLIGTDTSSRYTMRGTAEYRKMAACVLELILARRGNYLVFFSSYQMMDDVADQFELLLEERGETVGITRQMSGMTEDERKEFLAQFEIPHENGFAGFCVMGGIFGEGIDLREDRLIGAVVAGTGIPQICTEREMLKQFYDQRGEDGFFYAYLCPGMNKVLQSAGRVIRTEEDAGVILLMDERFDENRYRRMFPEEWGQPQTCTLQSVRGKAASFWESLDQKS